MTDLAPEIYYAAACFAFILTFLICGIIRWFHLCRPFDKNRAYFYPAHKLVALSYMTACLQVPYLFYWHSADAWLFVRSFFIIYIPVISALAFKRFFFGDSRWQRLRMAVVGGFPATVVAVLFVFACCGGDISEQTDLITDVVVVVALLLFAYLLRVTVWLRKQIKDFLHGEYSDEDDFPVRFASTSVFRPIIASCVAWGVFLCDSRALTACFSIAISITGLIFLLVILHPQRSGNGLIPVMDGDENLHHDSVDMDANAADADLTPCPPLSGTLPDYMKDKLEKQIRRLVDEQQLFLRPGLKRSELSELLGSNRTYLSVVFKERFGSFYSYVNTLRIEYAIRYAADHPEADQQEVALNSGFGSLKTYNRVKKAYETECLAKGADK